MPRARRFAALRSRLARRRDDRALLAEINRGAERGRQARRMRGWAVRAAQLVGIVVLALTVTAALLLVAFVLAVFAAVWGLA